MKITWFSLILLLTLTINKLSEARHGHKLHSAVVSGSVHCDICSQDFSKAHHFIPGASVAVECKDRDSRPSFRQEAKTDEHGEFKVRLPFSVTKNVKKIKRCLVKVLGSSEPYCAVASSATSSSLNLKSSNQGTHIFSAGILSFKPLKQPKTCNENSKESNNKSTMEFGEPNYPIFPPPLQDPTTVPQPTPLLPNLPPLPRLPQLPPLLPPLPLLPIPPIGRN
ncbi:cyclin-dependent kinase 12-like [Hibiscus syriacus]|uniref:cyclin-dependent kinase 12-like n=1 Tax=Hibiscus syriacus TaxID=106335 RepID=UPI00192102B0|nr:cyclin-dependent kinase 12-like [Hibiscus syriacus]